MVLLVIQGQENLNFPKIIQDINQPWTVLLSFDNFYQPLTLEQSKLAFANNYDFDCPDSLDFDLLVETIGNLKKEVKLLSQFIRSLHIIVLQN